MDIATFEADGEDYTQLLRLSEELVNSWRNGRRVRFTIGDNGLQWDVGHGWTAPVGEAATLLNPRLADRLHDFSHGPDPDCNCEACKLYWAAQDRHRVPPNNPHHAE